MPLGISHTEAEFYSRKRMVRLESGISYITRVLFTIGRGTIKVIALLNTMDAAKVATEVCVRISYPESESAHK